MAQSRFLLYFNAVSLVLDLIGRWMRSDRTVFFFVGPEDRQTPAGRQFYVSLKNSKVIFILRATIVIRSVRSSFNYKTRASSPPES